MKTLAGFGAFCLYLKGAFALPKFIYGHEPYPEQVPDVILMALAGLGLIACLAYLVKLSRTPTRPRCR